MRATCQLLGYYLSLVFFGTSGLLLTVCCLLTAWVPATDRTERFFQRLIHRLFAVFVWWGRFIRLMYVRHHAFERLPRGGCVLAANHPGLMDITFILARLPEALCVFKPAIRRNPVLGAAENIVVIFPEGTRTPPGADLGTFRPGFVLMARRAARPIQLVRISWNSNVLVKGRPWWARPSLPARIEVTVGPRLLVAADADTAAATAEIEAWFRAGPEAAACQPWSSAFTVQALPS